MFGVGFVLTYNAGCFPVKNIGEIDSGIIMYKFYDCHIRMSLYALSEVMFLCIYFIR